MLSWFLSVCPVDSELPQVRSPVLLFHNVSLRQKPVIAVSKCRPVRLIDAVSPRQNCAGAHVNKSFLEIWDSKEELIMLYVVELIVAVVLQSSLQQGLNQSMTLGWRGEMEKSLGIHRHGNKRGSAWQIWESWRCHESVVMLIGNEG